MLAKCRGNLVNGRQRTQRSNIGSSITCSVMKNGYEWLLTKYSEMRAVEQRESTVRQNRTSSETSMETSDGSKRHSRPRPLNQYLSKGCTYRNHTAKRSGR